MTSNRQIFLTESDLDKLEQLIESTPSSRYTDSLSDELGYAVIVSPDKIPADVVTMNSKVRFEDVSTGEESMVMVTYPPQADASAGRVSVLAPIGAALLGLSVNEVIEWRIPGGKTRILKIKEVLYQPEAAGKSTA